MCRKYTLTEKQNVCKIGDNVPQTSENNPPPPNIILSVYKPIKLLTFTQTKLRYFKALRLEVNKAFAGKVKAFLHRLGIEIAYNFTALVSNNIALLTLVLLGS